MKPISSPTSPGTPGFVPAGKGGGNKADSIHFFRSRAAAASETGNYRDAIGLLGSALKAAGEVQGREVALIHAEIGDAYAGLGDFHGANDSYTTALFLTEELRSASSPEDMVQCTMDVSDMLSNLAFLMYTRALACARFSRSRKTYFDAAARQYNCVVLTAPEDSAPHLEGLLNLGALLVNAGDLQKAVSTFERAVSTQKKHQLYSQHSEAAVGKKLASAQKKARLSQAQRAAFTIQSAFRRLKSKMIRNGCLRVLQRVGRGGVERDRVFTEYCLYLSRLGEVERGMVEARRRSTASHLSSSNMPQQRAAPTHRGSVRQRGSVVFIEDCSEHSPSAPQRRRGSVVRSSVATQADPKIVLFGERTAHIQPLCHTPPCQRCADRDVVRLVASTASYSERIYVSPLLPVSSSSIMIKDAKEIPKVRSVLYATEQSLVAVLKPCVVMPEREPLFASEITTSSCVQPEKGSVKRAVLSATESALVTSLPAAGVLFEMESVLSRAEETKDAEVTVLEENGVSLASPRKPAPCLAVQESASSVAVVVSPAVVLRAASSTLVSNTAPPSPKKGEQNEKDTPTTPILKGISTFLTTAAPLGERVDTKGTVGHDMVVGALEGCSVEDGGWCLPTLAGLLLRGQRQRQGQGEHRCQGENEVPHPDQDGRTSPGVSSQQHNVHNTSHTASIPLFSAEAVLAVPLSIHNTTLVGQERFSCVKVPRVGLIESSVSTTEAVTEKVVVPLFAVAVGSVQPLTLFGSELTSSAPSSVKTPCSMLAYPRNIVSATPKATLQERRASLHNTVAAPLDPWAHSGSIAPSQTSSTAPLFVTEAATRAPRITPLIGPELRIEESCSFWSGSCYGSTPTVGHTNYTPMSKRRFVADHIDHVTESMAGRRSHLEDDLTSYGMSECTPRGHVVSSVPLKLFETSSLLEMPRVQTKLMGCSVSLTAARKVSRSLSLFESGETLRTSCRVKPPLSPRSSPLITSLPVKLIVSAPPLIEGQATLTSPLLLPPQIHLVEHHASICQKPPQNCLISASKTTTQRIHRSSLFAIESFIQKGRKETVLEVVERSVESPVRCLVEEGTQMVEELFAQSVQVVMHRAVQEVDLIGSEMSVIRPLAENILERFLFSQQRFVSTPCALPESIVNITVQSRLPEPSTPLPTLPSPLYTQELILKELSGRSMLSYQWLEGWVALRIEGGGVQRGKGGGGGGGGGVSGPAGGALRRRQHGGLGGVCRNGGSGVDLQAKLVFQSAFVNSVEEEGGGGGGQRPRNPRKPASARTQGSGRVFGSTTPYQTSSWNFR